MKFMIAGLGSIGRRHLRNLFSLGEQDIILYRTNHSTLDLEEFWRILALTTSKPPWRKDREESLSQIQRPFTWMLRFQPPKPDVRF